MQGHGEAVELFRSILPSLPLGTELHLIGNLMNGAPHEGYLQGVKQVRRHWQEQWGGVGRGGARQRIVQGSPGLCGVLLLLAASRCLLPTAALLQKAEGLPVTFHVSAPTADVEAVLHSALVQWHLTGACLPTHTPTSVAGRALLGCAPCCTAAQHGWLSPCVP